MNTFIAFALVVLLLVAIVTAPWLLLQVACLVLGCYALWRAFLEGLRRLAAMVEEDLRP